MATARLDLDDTHGNTETGVHTAAMAGTWMGVVYGFAGMRLQDGLLRFAPNLPDKWSQYQFNVRFRGELLQVRVDRNQTVYTLLEGDALSFHHRDLSIHLRGRGTAEAVAEAQSRHEDSNEPSGREAGGPQSSETGD